MYKRKIIAGALCTVALSSMLLTPIQAQTVDKKDISDTYQPSFYSQTEEEKSSWKRYVSLHTVQNKSVYAYQRKTVTVSGKNLTVKSLTVNGADYIPSRAFANALGMSYSYNSATKTATLRWNGLEATFSAGCYVSYANGRALFSTSPVTIFSDGRMYVPAEVISRVVGLSYSSSDSIRLSGTPTPIVSADKFYKSDEVFWLARIIQAEAGGEPLLGQIAVGNVVMNRVRSSYYPNTIYGVIFDRKYGVQFSPVSNGAIYNTPGYNATLAAKICLEGYDVSDGAFFFLRPELSTSSWIPNSRVYAFSVGNHDFYY